MRKIKTVNAAGHMLCHDVTQIIKDEKKDAAFRKGHIIQDEDIPVLLSLGKDHIFIWENQDGMLHENEAAEILSGICLGQGIGRAAVKEGKIELFAERSGLFCVDIEKLDEINTIDGIVIASRHTFFPVKKGDKLAGVRVIPLVYEEEKLLKAKSIASATPIMNVLPYNSMKAGIVTVGNEVYYGRIKDSFTPVVIEKLAQYGITVCGQIIVSDDKDNIASAIKEHLCQGAQLVVCTGGMSVDPDDITPEAIRACSGNIVTYGAPVLPGAMFMLAYTSGNIPLVGLPGCVMYSGTTIFDVVLPRITAGVQISKRDFIKMANGGLCLECDSCVYPDCGFGKGV